MAGEQDRNPYSEDRVERDRNCCHQESEHESVHEIVGAHPARVGEVLPGLCEPRCERLVRDRPDRYRDKHSEVTDDEDPKSPLNQELAEPGVALAVPGLGADEHRL